MTELDGQSDEWEEHEDVDPIPEVHVITLVINTEKHAPELDIGDIPPQSAVTFLRQAADTLTQILHPPKITYRGDIVFEMLCENNEDED